MGAPPDRTKNVAPDMDAVNLAEEDANDGWNPNTKPVGGEPKRHMWPPDND